MTALACFTALEEVPRLLVAREDLRDLMEYTLLLLLTSGESTFRGQLLQYLETITCLMSFSTGFVITATA